MRMWIFDPAELCRDEEAADALPMRFTVTALMVLLLVALFTTAVLDLRDVADRHHTDIALSKITSNAQQMTLRGAGTMINIEIEIPSDTQIVLGALPGSENVWPEDANNYYSQTGEQRVIHETDALFSNVHLDGPYTLSPGPHQITLETVTEASSGKRFVKIYET
ncbi:MAG: hypothetical protein U9N13_06695 [Euryarchaeota archaeon]|nr:hypothetical protein [Euryarchaeota archaeon]